MAFQHTMSSFILFRESAVKIYADIALGIKAYPEKEKEKAWALLDFGDNFATP
jgi:hypothetical protein